MNEARESGIEYYTFRNPRIALDIDQPDDLAELMLQSPKTKTQEILRELNFIDKKAG